MAGGLLLASAATASAQDRPDSATAPALDMARIHQQMTEHDPGMTSMLEVHADQNRGMTRMYVLMTDGPR